MVSISPMRAVFVVTLALLVITGIVALAIDKSITSEFQLISYAISVGVYSAISSVPPIGWMMASLWVSVIGVIIATVFLFSDPESI
ncbi:hypothetical protein FBUS_03800 [Fasciolopsis buskii]|uniref:Uncharacterized protein n=1 Tax=Fasciolopsis buskii TaxID=27845 RepID=A0A8E0RNQ1_9TREM|nr:hypothetical protein FBUS_03800 [Fasciolopsis buski]